MKFVIVDLNLNMMEAKKYYLGQAKFVRAATLDGKLVQFPARLIRNLIDHNGIEGLFKIFYTEDGKFVQIQKILR